MAANGVRTYLKPSIQSAAILGRFNDCVVDCLRGSDSDETNEVFVTVVREKNQLILAPSNEQNKEASLLRHPPFCPIKLFKANKNPESSEEEEDDGVRVGIVALIESSDEHVLVTRRAAHMRTFPGVWVPPGGGADEGETIEQTALRELDEETGLNVEAEIESSQILCLWESVFPPYLDWGNPKRHHIVVYMHFRLNSDCASLNERIVLHPEEVDASAWLSKEQVFLVVNGVLSGDNEDELPPGAAKTFLMKVLASDGKMSDSECSAQVLLAKAPKNSGADVTRMSTGTRFALSQWLLCKSNKEKKCHL